MSRWEYLSMRFDYKGRGIAQEFNLLDVNGQRLTGWMSESGNTAKTLPEFLALVGVALGACESRRQPEPAGEQRDLALYALQASSYGCLR